MVVDDKQGVAAYLQVPCHAAIACGAVGDALTAEDGKAGMDTDTVQIPVAVEHEGVVIGVFLLVVLEAIAPPSVDIFLQADDISILLEEVVTDSLKALLVLIVASVLTDVIAEELEGSLRRGTAHVEGHINSNRYVGKEVAGNGDDDHAELEEDPEKEEGEVGKEKQGERHADTRQDGVVDGVQPVTVANKAHDDDGGDIGTCHQLDGECL